MLYAVVLEVTTDRIYNYCIIFIVLIATIATSTSSGLNHASLSLILCLCLFCTTSTKLSLCIFAVCYSKTVECKGSTIVPR